MTTCSFRSKFTTALIATTHFPPQPENGLYGRLELRCPYDQAQVIRVDDHATCPTCRNRWKYTALEPRGWDWLELGR